MLVDTIKTLIADPLTAIKFGFVGVLNTAFFAIVAWLLESAGWHYVAYTTAAYILAMLFSFVMNHCFTFRGFNGGPLLGVFFRFLFVTIGLLIVVQFVQHGIIEYLKFPELVGVICGMFVYTGVGFALNRLWVFDDQKLIRCSQPD